MNEDEVTLNMARELTDSLRALQKQIMTSIDIQKEAAAKLLRIRPHTFRHMNLLNRPDLIELASKK